jgi:hypothetical protein
MRAPADHVHRAGHDDADARAGKMGGKEAAWRPRAIPLSGAPFRAAGGAAGPRQGQPRYFLAEDDALDDPDLLPPPDEVAAEIVESLETALERFRGAAKALGEMPV